MDEVRTEVMFVDQVDAEGSIGCVTDGAAVTAVDSGGGAVKAAAGLGWFCWC